MRASKAYESPLISHARMRLMYRSLVEIRAAGEDRGGRVRPLGRISSESQTTLPRGQEACWVGTAIGLEPQDLTCDLTSDLPGGKAGSPLAHIRAAALRTSDRSARAKEMATLLQVRTTNTFGGTARDRMLCAIGGAMALKDRVSKPGGGEGGGGQAVMMAYVSSSELSSAGWRQVLQLVAAEPLPMVIVAVPGETGRPTNLSALARRAGCAAMPVIAVDAADVIALYRVAQESLVRARAGGGSAVIEGVASALDPAAMLEAQLRAKRICSASWFSKAGVDLARTLTQIRH